MFFADVQLLGSGQGGAGVETAFLCNLSNLLLSILVSLVYWWHLEEFLERARLIVFHIPLLLPLLAVTCSLWCTSSIWVTVISAAPKMPLHCSMRLCTKKEYRKEEIGEKVSYFKLLTEEGLRKLWIHAIKYISVHFQRVWKRMTVG